MKYVKWYSGGYAELVRAFAKSRPVQAKLIEYCTAVDNIAVTKRLGYLAELFNRNDLADFIEFAVKKTNKVYNLFDPR